MEELLLLVMTRSGIGPVDQERSGTNSPGRDEGRPVNTAATKSQDKVRMD